MRWILLILMVLLRINIHAQIIQFAQPVRFLALGDSYTIGQSVETIERWPVQLKDELQNLGIGFSELKIIAQTGWRTDNLMNAIETQNPDSNYNLVSLLIGVNNQFQRSDFETYILEFEQLLKTAIKLADDVKNSVFVVSIPDYGYTPFGIDSQKFISEEIDKYNLANKQITQKYGVAYINITPISREGIEKPEYVAGDGLHPSGVMYEEWVKLILEAMNLNETTAAYNLRNEPEFKIFVNAETRKIVFPTDQLTDKNQVFQVIDISGRIHLSGNLPKNDIDISGLDRGVYMVQIKNDDGNKFVKKFMIVD